MPRHSTAGCGDGSGQQEPGDRGSMPDQTRNRALTYTEMMNGGRQQMDDAEQRRESVLRLRIEQMEQDVEHLRKSLG